MATQAQCAYCFECLVTNFDKSSQLLLARVEELWGEYVEEIANNKAAQDNTTEKTSPKPAAVSRLLGKSPSSSSKASSASSTTNSSGASTPASSVSSKASSTFRTRKDASHPLFITWNTISESGGTSLRGCIGTFEPLPLQQGLTRYTLIAALEDHRFRPISKSELPSLQVCVTLLTNFSEPDNDPLNWTVGEHGIRLSFVDRGRRYNSTYLPDVAKEQGWTKEEAITSLMRKAGWGGRMSDWRNVQGLQIVRYEGKKVELTYDEWRRWKTWAQETGRA